MDRWLHSSLTGCRWPGALALGLLTALAGASASAGEKAFRLPDTDLKQPIIWGAECEGPDGGGLAFGGQDQRADDGRPHTRVREGGAWKAIHDELRAANPLQKFHDRAWALRTRQKNAAARARALYFQGLPPAEGKARFDAEIAEVQTAVAKDLDALVAEIEKLSGLAEYETRQAALARSLLLRAAEKTRPLPAAPDGGPSAETVKAMSAAQADLEKATEALDAEPPPRALSPIAYDPKTRVYVLFGGDHLDYLTNDTWEFSPASKRWRERHPPSGPPPRAGHRLRATGDGTIILTGGYTYTSSTDYCGGQYRNLGDGDWTYDAAAGTWAGAGQAEPPGARVYRTGPFHPDFFLDGPRPDAGAVEARLKALPANAWVPMNPPQIPRLDRCWGTAVLDPDRDQVLVWAGGHSSHGGTDVLHYHLSTNRWELPYPVEFPLGQLYSNTSYPAGFNFNLRPWVTGHTYQNYGYDPTVRKMLFTGHPEHFYLYDPDAADWAGRGRKPPAMVYNDCFYTLTLCPTPRGMMCWTPQGKVLRFEAAAGTWAELQVTGKLPGASVDYSTVVYDSRRDRLVFFRAPYGKTYDGQVHALDLKTLAATALSPGNMAAAGPGAFPIDRACYDPESDLVLMAGLLPPVGGEPARTAAYDGAGNRWVSLNITCEIGKDAKPLTPRGPGHSSGLMYDGRRQIFWGVDTYHCQVYALRLDARRADVAAMK